MRKTIYVPSQEVWDEVKRKADEAGTTVSKYLLGSNHVPDLWVGDQLDRIEEKLDNFLVGDQLDRIEEKIDKFIIKLTEFEGHKNWFHDGKGPKPTEPSAIRKKKIESSKGKDLSPKISRADEEMLKEKMELIASKKPASLTGWVGGFSKAQQVGKK